MIANGTSDFLKHGALPEGMQSFEGVYVLQRTEDGKAILMPYGTVTPPPGKTVSYLLCEPSTFTPYGPIVLMPTCFPNHIQTEKAENMVSVFEYAEKWLESAKTRVKDSTYNKYRNTLHSYVIPDLGELKWCDVNREQVEKFTKRMLSNGGKKGTGLTEGTVGGILTVLGQVFDYAAEHGADVSFDISSITVKKEQKEVKVLTFGDQKKLCRYLRNHPSERNIGILICIYTGLRIGEVCGLRWEDISFSDRTIIVRRAVQRIQTNDDQGRKTKVVITTPKSASSVRTIPIPSELFEILLSFRGDRSGYILTGSRDKFVEPRTMERQLDKVLQEAGIEHVNFHALRHTFATRCVEIDFEVKSLSEILGHSSVNITLNRYVHPSMNLKRSNMEKLSGLLAAG